MTNIIGNAPLQSPSFNGDVEVKGDIKIGLQTSPTSTSYPIAEAAASGSTTLVVTGDISWNNYETFSITGTGIPSYTTILSSTYVSPNSTITISSPTTSALDTTNSINLSIIPNTSISLYANGSNVTSAAISAQGGTDSILNGALNFNAGSISLNPSTSGIMINGKTTINGPSIINGDQTINGLSTLSGNLVVNGTITGTSNMAIGSQVKPTGTDYTTSADAAKGATVLVVTGEVDWHNWDAFDISGTGVSTGTEIIGSTYDSTAGTSTLTLNTALSDAIPSGSTVTITIVPGVNLQFYSDGSSTYSGQVSCVGGGTNILEGTMNFTAGNMNYNSSGDINFNCNNAIFSGNAQLPNGATFGTPTFTGYQQLNFQTGAKGATYDSQISATGGTAENGGGALSIIGDSFNVQSAFNIMNSSFNLGLNQTKAGATFINFFSNGNNEYADFTLQSYGGADAAAGGGTVSLTCSMVQMKCNEVDMSDCSWGVMVPTPASTDATSQKAVNMTYLTTNYAVKSSSDPILKDNMTLIKPKSLQDLDKIDLYSYNWKKDGSHVPVGFNSKNLLEVWPDTVEEHDNHPDTINLLNLIARQMDMIRELKTEIEILKSKNDKGQPNG